MNFKSYLQLYKYSVDTLCSRRYFLPPLDTFRLLTVTLKANNFKIFAKKV